MGIFELVQQGQIIECFVEDGQMNVLVADNCIEFDAETLQIMLDMLKENG